LQLPAVALRGAGFVGNATGYSLGAIKIVIGQSDAFVFEPRSKKGGDEDFWKVTLRLSGFAEIEIDGRTVRQEGNALDVRRLGQPLRGYLSANHSLSLYLPRPQFAGLASTLDQLANSHHGGPGFHPLLAHYLSAMASVLPSASAQEVDLMAETTQSMIRACVTTSGSMGLIEEAPLMAARLEIARQYVSSNLKSPDLSSKALGAKLNVSRRQLYKIFEAEGGVEKYVLSSRLKASYDAIRKSGHLRTIAAIAEEFGFADSATFSRQFRARFGCCPSDVRTQVRSFEAESGFSSWLFATSN
jgi:AraC-like DNA-binding protein